MQNINNALIIKTLALLLGSVFVTLPSLAEEKNTTNSRVNNVFVHQEESKAIDNKDNKFQIPEAKIINPKDVVDFGKSKNVTRDVTTFSAVRILCNCNVKWTRSTKAYVKILNVGEKMEKFVVSKVDKDKLSLSANVGSPWSGITQIEIGSLFVDDIDIAGPGTFSIENINAGKIKVKVSGTGSAYVKGNGTDANILLTGPGKADLSHFLSKKVTIRHTGQGITRAKASNELEIQTTGSGKIEIYSNPPKQNIIPKKAANVFFEK